MLAITTDPQGGRRAKRRAHHPSPISLRDGGHASAFALRATADTSLCPPYGCQITSQLPCIRKRERTHPPCILVQDQRARDRRFGALAAVFAFAKPAVDADRGALRFLQIHSGGVDKFGGVTDFAAQ